MRAALEGMLMDVQMGKDIPNDMALTLIEMIRTLTRENSDLEGTVEDLRTEVYDLKNQLEEQNDGKA